VKAGRAEEDELSRAHAKKSTPQARLSGRALDTTEFDQELVAETFAPPPAEARAQWEQARRKPGRPRKGRGAKVISVSVEEELLARSDALAKRMGVSRAGLIARGLRAVLAVEGEL
jgi:hypothetical protein